MELFNRIQLGPYCPKCGDDMEWQTKALFVREYPVDLQMMMIDLEEDMSGEGHAICDTCDCYYEAVLECGKLHIVWCSPLGVMTPARGDWLGRKYVQGGKIKERGEERHEDKE